MLCSFRDVLTTYAILADRSCGSERSERLTASEASLGGGMGQGWRLEVGRARVGAIFGDG